MTKVKTGKAQTHTTIRTATSLSRTITDDEIDTTVIDEEWIEYMKNNHRRSHSKDGECEDSMLEQDSDMNEMETGAESSNITE